MTPATAATAPAAAAVPAIQTVSADALLSGLALPEVNARAVAASAPAATAPAASAAPAGPEIRDALGKVFRPGFHRVTADGSPFRGARGQFMPRGGRRPGSVSAPGAPNPAPTTPEAGSSVPARLLGAPAAPPPPGPAGPAPEAPKPAAIPLEICPPEALDAAAETALRSAYHIADTVCDADGEWQPSPESEHESLKKCLIAWFEARGGKPWPAWVSFTLSAVTYVLKRLRKPKTAARLASLGLGAQPPAEPAKPAAAGQPAPAPEPRREPAKPAPLSADLGAY